MRPPRPTQGLARAAVMYVFGAPGKNRHEHHRAPTTPRVTQHPRWLRSATACDYIIDGMHHGDGIHIFDGAGVRAMAARQMVSVENALRVAMAEAQQGCRPRKQRVSCSNLASVLGCVLAEPVYSPSAVPAYRASIKDGYAIPMPVRVGRADDEGLLPLRVLGTARAGEQPHTGSAGDQNQNGVASAASDEAVCWYVSTGGALPDGADAVLMVEHVQRTVEGDDGDTHILVSQDAISALRPGQDVRQVGSDIAQGELLLEAGTRVGEVEVWLVPEEHHAGHCPLFLCPCYCCCCSSLKPKSSIPIAVKCALSHFVFLLVHSSADGRAGDVRCVERRCVSRSEGGRALDG